MSIGDLIPMALPAMAIICVAATLAVRGRSAGPDLVLDLRETPIIRLEPVSHARVPHAVTAVRGALVEPISTSLGARMRSMPPVDAVQSTDDVAEVRTPHAPRVRITRRRHPLVAVGRPEPH